MTPVAEVMVYAHIKGYNRTATLTQNQILRS